MLETLLWAMGGCLIGAGCASFVQGFMEAKKRKHPAARKASLDELMGVSPATTRDTQPEIMVKLLPAVNGRLIEISTKHPHPMHSGHFDWEHELFIVEEGQTLSQAIAMVMLMKGLEK